MRSPRLLASILPPLVYFVPYEAAFTSVPTPYPEGEKKQASCEIESGSLAARAPLPVGKERSVVLAFQMFRFPAGR